MAKKRIVLGNLSNPKPREDGTKGSRYVKLNLHPDLKGSVTLKNGEYINFEMFEEQVKSANAATQEGKISPETLEKILARIEKDKAYGAIGQAIVVREE